MMLAHPQMESVIDFENGCINTLVIENPVFFREYLRDITEQICGFAGKMVLSVGDMPIDLRGNAELIDSFLSFEIGRKALVSKLVSRMETAAVNESNYMRTAQLLEEWERYIQDLSFELPCDVICSKMSIGSILRAVGIDISDDYGNDLERLLDYMELTRELERDKLFIFVNLRSYYSEEDLSAFFVSILDHEFRVLLVDSSAGTVLASEARVTVDNDLCEF